MSKKNKKLYESINLHNYCNNFINLLIFNLIDGVDFRIEIVKLKHFFCFAWTQMLLRFESKKHQIPSQPTVPGKFQRLWAFD